MKIIAPAILLACLCAACTPLFPANDGNPNDDAYAGNPGSAYDAAANPPRTIGTVTYNPAIQPTNNVAAPPASGMAPANVP